MSNQEHDDSLFFWSGELPKHEDTPVVASELLRNLAKTPYAFDAVREELRTALEGAKIDSDLIDQLEIKPSPEGVEGDFGFHCAPLSKVLKRSPQTIAAEIASALPVVDGGSILKYVAVGAYVNIHIDYERYGSRVKSDVLELGRMYGSENIGQSERVVIDMSSPNIAKQMSIGHLRSTIIGDSLANIYSHLGYEVIKDNHLGDWGTQFGHLLRAIELWGDESIIAANPIAELQKLYVRISAAGDHEDVQYAGLSVEEAKRCAEEVKNEGRAWFLRLEKGDPLARERWQKIVEWSLAEFQRVYDVLGVTFDLVRGESFYEPMLSETIEELEKNGVATVSDGALVVDMSDSNLGAAVVRRTDGATQYITRDIAAALNRVHSLNADRMIYVVGSDQQYYFQQLFEILRRMGLEISQKSKHVYFGMITLPEGRMSTRKNKVILLEDVIAEAMTRTTELVDQSGKVTASEERERLIRQVAIGALKWNDLVRDPRVPIEFDIDRVLSMTGNSGPYVQYAYTRAMSVLDRAQKEYPGYTEDILTESTVFPEDPAEKELVNLVAAFPSAVQDAAREYSPSKIATAVYELSKSFNRFYHQAEILLKNRQDSGEREREIEKSRLALTAIVAQTIKTGLELLGIEAPARM